MLFGMLSAWKFLTLALVTLALGCGAKRGTLYEQHLNKLGGKKFPVLELAGAVTCYGGPFEIIVALPNGKQEVRHLEAFVRRGLDTATGKLVEDYVHLTPFLGVTHQTSMMQLGGPGPVIEIAAAYVGRGKTSADGAKVLMLLQRASGTMVLETRDASPERLQLMVRWFQPPSTISLATMDTLDFDSVPALLTAADAAGAIEKRTDASLPVIPAAKCQEIFTHFDSEPPKATPPEATPPASVSSAETTSGPFKLVRLEAYHVMVLPKGLLGALPLVAGNETVCGLAVEKPDGTAAYMTGTFALCDKSALIGTSVMFTTVRGRIQDKHCEGDLKCNGEDGINREEDLVKTMVAAP
jgi:hypothetical protein